MVFAYVDIFGFYRADVLRSALDRTAGTTTFEVDQTFLALTLAYVVVPILMVPLTLLARPGVTRPANVVVSAVYSVTIVASCVGEEWLYYLAGSVGEVVLLAVVLRTGVDLAQRLKPREEP